MVGITTYHFGIFVAVRWNTKILIHTIQVVIPTIVDTYMSIKCGGKEQINLK